MSTLDRIARDAENAFAIYSRSSGKQKAAILRAIASALEGNGDALIEQANRETSLGLPRLKNELGRTCNQMRMFAALVEEGSWVDARIDHGKIDVRSMRRPIGPVAVFGASNFPLAFSVPGGDTASALAAGCPVIVKAHPAHPETSRIAARAIEASVPRGVFALIEGFEAGIELVKHPAIKSVAFTGSRRGGRALMDLAAARPEPVPVFAEMGSINPVFILPRAMQSRGAEIAAGLHASVTLGVGQFCTNPGLVIASDSNAFVETLAAKMSATPCATMLTPSIAGAYRDGVERFASLAYRRAFVDGGAALFTADAKTFLDTEELRDEVFGPSTLVVQCDSCERMLDVARSLEGQLTATIHADEGDDVEELLRILETRVGRVVFNGFPTGVEVVPAMVHGGPYPATSDPRSTSDGTRAIERFTRLVAWQNAPDAMLPEELREANPLGISRLVDGVMSVRRNL